MNNVAIELTDIRYTYPDGTLALDGITLKIPERERVAFLGPNGAGKSTLLMHLNGLFTPSKGEIKIYGAAISKKNIHTIRKIVGVVFQDPDDQLFCPTLREDVAFGPRNMGLPEEEVERRVQDALRIVKLEGFEDKPPHHISLGQKKRAAIATILSMKPKILVLDEPTANLDPRNCNDLIQFLNKLHQSENITLITALHDVNLASRLADKIYLLDKGRVIAQGPPQEILTDQRLMDSTNLELPMITRYIKEIMTLNLALDDVKGSIPITIEEAIDKKVHLLNKETDKK